MPLQLIYYFQIAFCVLEGFDYEYAFCRNAKNGHKS